MMTSKIINKNKLINTSFRIFLCLLDSGTGSVGFQCMLIQTSQNSIEGDK